MLGTIVAVLALLPTASQSSEAEQARVRQHLLGAVALLREGTPADLTAAQRALREENIRRLHEYTERGVFPVNAELDIRAPYFIDATGTRCAMAHLIEASGHGDFVQRIARDRNNAYVSELVDEPELVAWLTENGMTAAEAARVQPTYSPRCAPYRVERLCSGAPGAAVELLVAAGDGGTVLRVVRHVLRESSGAIGDEFPLGSHEYRLSPYDAELGDRLFAIAGGPETLDGFGLIDSANNVVALADELCEKRPSVPVARLAEIVEAHAPARCAEELQSVDARFGERFCYDFDHSYSGAMNHCLATGKPDAERNAGPLGCGCASTGAALAALLALVPLTRRRRQKHRSPTS